MSDAVYVRFGDEELKFVKKIAHEEKITRSEAIKKLVSYAAKKLRIEKATTDYKEGKYTIREAAELANLRYFEFFDVLAQQNMLGTSPENIDLLLSHAKRL